MSEGNVNINCLEVIVWSWSYGSSMYNYICNQCLSLLTWVLIPFLARCTLCNIMWKRVSVTCERSMVFSRHSTNQTDRHDIPKKNEVKHYFNFWTLWHKCFALYNLWMTLIFKTIYIITIYCGIYQRGKQKPQIVEWLTIQWTH